MDVDCARQELAHYQSSAQRILTYLVDREPESSFLQYSLGLIVTYLRIPNDAIGDRGSDEIMARLAVSLYYKAQPIGLWNDIETIWSRFVGDKSNAISDDLRTELMTQWAIVRHNQGDLAGALSIYKAIAEHPAFPALSRVRRANTLQQMGICSLKLGQYQNARRLFERCLALTDQVELSQTAPEVPTSPLSEARALLYTRLGALHQLGNIHLYAGRFGQARRSYLEVLNGYEALGEGDQLGSIPMYSLGRLAVMQRRFSEAVPYLEAALAIRRRRNEVDGIAGNAIWLAGAYIGVNQYEEAEARIHEAVTLYRSINHPDGLMFCHLFSGILARRRGDRDESIAQQRAVQASAAKISISATLIATFVLSRELLAERDFASLVSFLTNVAIAILRPRVQRLWKPRRSKTSHGVNSNNKPAPTQGTR